MLSLNVSHWSIVSRLKETLALIQVALYRYFLFKCISISYILNFRLSLTIVGMRQRQLVQIKIGRRISTRTCLPVIKILPIYPIVWIRYGIIHLYKNISEIFNTTNCCVKYCIIIMTCGRFIPPFRSQNVLKLSNVSLNLFLHHTERHLSDF